MDDFRLTDIVYHTINGKVNSNIDELASVDIWTTIDSIIHYQCMFIVYPNGMKFFSYPIKRQIEEAMTNEQH